MIVWDLKRGSVTNKLLRHLGAISNVQYIGHALVSVGDDGLIAKWDPVNGILQKYFQADSGVTSICIISPNEFAVSFENGKIGLCSDNLKYIDTHNEAKIISVACTSSKLCVFVSENNSICVVDSEDRYSELRDAHQSVIWEIKYLEENYCFYTCSTDCTVKVWEVDGISLVCLNTICLGCPLTSVSYTHLTLPTNREV